MRAIVYLCFVIGVAAACSGGPDNVQTWAQASMMGDGGPGPIADAATVADAWMMLDAWMVPDAAAPFDAPAPPDATVPPDAGCVAPPPGGVDPMTGIQPLPGAGPPGSWGKWKVPTPTGDVYGAVTHCWFEDDGINIAVPGGHVPLAYNSGSCEQPGGFMGIDSGSFGEACVCDPAKPCDKACAIPRYIMETDPNPPNNIHEHEQGFGKPPIFHCGQNKQCVSVAHSVVVMHPSAGGPYVIDMRSAKCI